MCFARTSCALLSTATRWLRLQSEVSSPKFCPATSRPHSHEPADLQNNPDLLNDAFPALGTPKMFAKPRPKKSPLPPQLKKRKIEHTIEEINFDNDARQEYLTGFHKRKQQRIKRAQEEAQKREKEERREMRKQVRGMVWWLRPTALTQAQADELTLHTAEGTEAARSRRPRTTSQQTAPRVRGGGRHCRRVRV